MVANSDEPLDAEWDWLHKTVVPKLNEDMQHEITGKLKVVFIKAQIMLKVGLLVSILNSLLSYALITCFYVYIYIIFCVTHRLAIRNS